MATNITYENNAASISMCQKTYEKDAILAAAYLLTDQYHIQVNEMASGFHVLISSKGSAPVTSALVESFINECLDEQLRITLDKRSGKIRDLIVEHAFKPLNLQKKLEESNA